ncbi:YcaO-like family protein [Lactobacillus taiwanensis]|uniref:YcaO-like family protein n=1 Tax=Lactobacillus taiwanensis TaxID=508451 RepID=UPI000B981F0D|nr:YcaO-like family protein [Lactobacillus taiwanensis]MCR1916527.1 YcaO-like family protein [Lactobacillus taiwanensis]OYR96039.1 hypothetical protein CBF51_06470 [Lactobacillus taiwanensis]OYR98949.1 hypothetical protein CBF61_09850 [Lactobacillus taiwanensis]OYS15580.1 hypothetical protein CBF69_05205 [Lactobacillus taiwanensis]OYS20087.1 hypothetical protein CBF56_02570 [Lactobacillus taiwanensis]
MIQQISQEQYKLLLNNRNFFQDIECIKKVKNKIYVNFVKDISDIQKFNILENNNYYLSSKHKWIDVSYGRHNIIMNPNNPNILGYSYSDKSFNSKNKAVYEYFERLCCFTPQKVARINSKIYRIGYDKLGVEWSNSILNGEPKYWVNGRTMFSNNNVQIPYNFVFYGKPLNDVAKNLGSSNGVALGKSDKDAFTRALREYIERDALLTCWLNKGKDLFQVKLKHNIGMLDSILEQKIGVDCFVYRYKVNTNFIVWCQLTNYKNKQAYHSSGFSANPNIEKAITHALSEAWGALKHKEENIKSKNSNILKAIQNYYFDANNANKIKVLTKYTKLCGYSNLNNLVNIALEDKYQEIISVDLSIPELRNQGLYCQKVIGVGGNSMVFDYNLAPDMPKYLPLA